MTAGLNTRSISKKISELQYLMERRIIMRDAMPTVRWNSSLSDRRHARRLTSELIVVNDQIKEVTAQIEAEFPPELVSWLYV